MCSNGTEWSLNLVRRCHFIHRDIRPENFHVGLGPRAHLLYITNFDFAFRYFGRPKPKKDGPQ